MVHRYVELLEHLDPMDEDSVHTLYRQQADG